MSQITGRAFIRVNGSQLKSRPGATINVGGFNNETVNGDDGVHGFKQAVTQPSVGCTISHDENTSMTDLAKITDASITFETDTGKTLIMSPAWITQPPELNSQDGSVSLNFEGVRVEEA